MARTHSPLWRAHATRLARLPQAPRKVREEETAGEAETFTPHESRAFFMLGLVCPGLGERRTPRSLISRRVSRYQEDP